MAENKKSFILYCDLIHTIEKLPDEKAGQLFKHILKYVNDKNPIIEDDLILELVFEPIKQQLKRDLDAWEINKYDKSQSGILGNLKRWHNDLYKQVIENQINIDEAQSIAHSRKVSHTDKVPSQPIANIAVNVTANVNDSVNDNDNEIKKNYFEQFWNLYDKKVERKSCFNKFMKLDLKVIEKIINVVPFYVKSTPDLKYRKNPETWINGECWNDEIKETDKKEEGYTLANGSKISTNFAF
jgi:hypothetical protein